MLASIGVMIEVFRGREALPEGAEPGEPFQRADFRTMAIIVLSIGLYTFLLERTGYIISSTIAFWGVAYAFGAKKMFRLGVIALVFSVIIYFAFTNLLGIQLPKWVLENLIAKIGG